MNTQADALSRLPILGSTTAPIDEDMPCFRLSESDDDDVALTEHITPLDLDSFNFETDSEIRVSDEPLLTASSPNTTNSADHIVTAWILHLVPIALIELERAQASDPFCVDICRRLGKGERLLSTKDTTNRLLFPISDGPYRFISELEGTVVIRTGDQDERVSRDRFVEAPPPPSALQEEVDDLTDTKTSAPSTNIIIETPQPGSGNNNIQPSPDTGSPNNINSTKDESGTEVSLTRPESGSINPSARYIPPRTNQGPASRKRARSSAYEHAESQLYHGGTLITTINLDTNKPTGDGGPFSGASYPESGQSTNSKSGYSTATSQSKYVIDRIVNHAADSEKTGSRVRWHGYPLEQDS